MENDDVVPEDQEDEEQGGTLLSRLLKKKKKESEAIERRELESLLRSTYISPELSRSSSENILTEKDLEDLQRSNEPSYRCLTIPYSLICEMRLTRKITETRTLMKDELRKLTAEQASAYESVRISRMYKTGIVLPQRIFQRDEKVQTFQEMERMRFLMTHDIF